MLDPGGRVWGGEGRGGGCLIQKRVRLSIRSLFNMYRRIPKATTVVCIGGIAKLECLECGWGNLSRTIYGQKCGVWVQRASGSRSFKGDRWRVWRLNLMYSRAFINNVKIRIIIHKVCVTYTI